MCIGEISCLPNVTDIGQCYLDRPYKCHHGHVIGVTCRLVPVKSKYQYVEEYQNVGIQTIQLFL